MEFLEIFFETQPFKLISWNLDIKTGLLFGITGLIVAAVSFFDDILELPVWFRFMTLILCSGIVIGVSDLSITSLGNLFGFGEIKLSSIFSIIFTIFCVVGVANAFNWIDGLDGLFSTQVLILVSTIFYFNGGNGIFYVIFFIIFAIMILSLSNILIIHLAILSLLIHLVSQIIYLDIDNSDRCLKIFKSNNLLGLQISFFLILELVIN